MQAKRDGKSVSLAPLPNVDHYRLTTKSGG